MEAIRKRFPWMTAADEAWLRQELLRRAAAGFEQAEAWREAAECWADLGEHARAGQCYAHTGDQARAAEALLDAGEYAAALDVYRAWEAALPAGDLVNRARALLGQAACHFLGMQEAGSRRQEAGGKRQETLSTQAGQTAYRQARSLIEQSAIHNQKSKIPCWAALGAYGARLGRYDLVQAGYEEAMAGAEGHARAELVQAYLAAARAWGDGALAQTLETELVEWEGQFVPDEVRTPPTYEELVLRSQYIQPLGQLHGHTDHVTSIAFSPDGELLVSGGKDGTIRLWNIKTCREIGVVQLASPVYCIAFSPDGQQLASGSADRRVRLWNLRDREAGARILRTNVDLVYSVAYSPDGRLLASGGGDLHSLDDDCDIWLWDAQTCRRLDVLGGHKAPVVSLSFSPDGEMLASGSRDATVCLWKVSTGQLIHTYREHTADVLDLAFSPDGNYLASASDDRTVHLWDVKTHELLYNLGPHRSWVKAVAWSQDGVLLISRSVHDNVAIRFWHAKSGRVVYTLPQMELQPHAYEAKALAISTNGHVFATYAPETLHDIQLWDISPLGIGAK